MPYLSSTREWSKCGFALLLLGAVEPLVVGFAFLEGVDSVDLLLDLEPVESAYILLVAAALRLGAMVRECVFSRRGL